MKPLVFLFIALFSLASFSQNEVEQVAQMLDDWHQAAAKANDEAYFSKMTKDAIFIGTDPTENWTKTEFKAFSKPYFDKGTAWEFIPFERNIYVENNLAWFDELLNSEHMGICRGSGVLIKKDGKWFIKHYVLSLSVPNEKMSEIVPLKAQFEKSFLEKNQQKSNK
ncbi:nuclear transport factor 2 family protein [Mesonia sp. K7]|uniref:nuclear transport factor 2 family protein n=1 Tax=Mesonia sp. K7 TaxID=2218606 RepID=UPI000DA99F42|nr:nuclear transport factor 2 family protein [Mesonia sp. K7]PZD78461.1 protein with SnoaL 3 domain, NTF 2 superfamily [Mesonia sp. K7]